MSIALGRSSRNTRAPCTVHHGVTHSCILCVLFRTRLASEMTTNMTSQEQLMKAAVQSQLARIIKEEEEEELWISGEELYTEGSSDEEECTTQSTIRRKTNSNQSSHVTSAETKAKTTCSIGIAKSNSTEGQTPKVPKTQTITQTTNSSTEWDEIDDTKISWKTKRDIDDAMVALKELRSLKELAELDTGSLQGCLTEESFDNDSENVTDCSDKWTYATDDECIEKEISEVKTLDNLMRRMNGRVKKAREETSICQRENRERLRKILSAAGSSENGKLAENTQLFLRLCPSYVTLSAENERNTKELCLKYDKNDSTAAKAESYTDNVSNISLEANDLKLQAFRNEGTTNASDPCDSSNDRESLNEQWEITSTSSDVERVMADAFDFDKNPYVVDDEAKNILLEAEKKLSVYQKDLRNDRGRFLGAADSMSDRSTMVSTIDSLPTMESLRGVDKDLLAEVIKEAGIIDPSSI
ncbi:uncharacterized protein LOC143361437 isoform X2 [Halictus rubicundus]|uniref:uncharacterized protein LOC143361437 isoform X2 n=1 Tax=Halictus rubicundus TaxID=77578 RepID=UPI0040354AFD